MVIRQIDSAAPAADDETLEIFRSRPGEFDLIITDYNLYIPSYELMCSMMHPSLSDAKAAVAASYMFKAGRPDAVLAKCSSSKGLRERDVVKEIFGRYVTTQVSDEVLKGNVNLGGESRRVTILFSDIRDFTAMAEEMEPTQVVDFLNDYFSEMVEAVFEYGGVLDEFMGDGMLAVFGSFGDAPIILAGALWLPFE